MAVSFIVLSCVLYTAYVAYELKEEANAYSIEQSEIAKLIDQGESLTLLNERLVKLQEFNPYDRQNMLLKTQVCL